MRRGLAPFVFVLATLLGSVYLYAAMRLVTSLAARELLALPFLAVFVVPLVYWGFGRDVQNAFDRALHVFAYMSMGWLSFVLVFSVLREVLGAVAALAKWKNVSATLAVNGGMMVLLLACLGFVVGAAMAAKGPAVKTVDIKIRGLDKRLNGLRIAQISDLHVGTMIRRGYVERVVAATKALKPDLIALTGDIVDGAFSEWKNDAMPLAELAAGGQAYYCSGNHEYYADAPQWLKFFRGIGVKVLENEHVTANMRGANVMVAGVLDPAVRILGEGAAPDAARAAATAADGLAVDHVFKLLLAHNPKLAPEGAKAGFHLQLSGHTHAGQFFPWTIVTKMVHAPHFAGISQEGRMTVYVSAGTGTWGPPVRLGTRPELTLVRLVAV